MLVRTTLILFSLLSVTQADIWLETPSGFYVLSLDSSGAPTTPVLAPNITGYEFMGKAPKNPPKLPPTKDAWGLAALSAIQANLIQNDPNYDGNASKLYVVYTEIGKKVQKNELKDKDVPGFLDMGFKVAVGSSITHWTPWKNSIGNAFNNIVFKNSQERGQALIDIGVGVGSTSNAATTDWIKIFIEVILPKIIEGASFMEILLAIIQALF